MDYSKESIDRQKKIQNMKDAGIICYANNFRWKEDLIKLRETSKSKYKEVDFLMENWAVWEHKTAGRIISSRGMWKLTFAKIRDNTWDIQVCFMRDKVNFNTGRELVNELEIGWEMKSAYKIAEKFCQVWDYVWIIWDLFLTKHWEITIFTREFQVLSKAVRPLPEKFHWVQDQETIYRQRYLDLITNQDSYDRFLFRSKFIKTIRDFYEENSFIEIETPVLWNAASWAAAAPFITHHNDFDEDYFLRISPETALKKATVGRFERVVEFTRNFRNEGSDPSHVQEFSAIEHYACWWNFEDNISFTEDMFDYIFDKLKLNKEIEIKDKEWKSRMVNFTTPWDRIDYIAWVKEKSGIDIEAYSEKDADKLRADIKKAW
jgi:lysyl-tRNA synthetase class 2